jgi:hypothetical protein
MYHCWRWDSWCQHKKKYMHKYFSLETFFDVKHNVSASILHWKVNFETLIVFTPSSHTIMNLAKTVIIIEWTASFFSNTWHTLTRWSWHKPVSFVIWHCQKRQLYKSSPSCMIQYATWMILSPPRLALWLWEHWSIISTMNLPVQNVCINERWTNLSCLIVIQWNLWW